jgi:hypothetical protein
VDAGVDFLIVTLLLHLFMSVLLDCKRHATDLTRTLTRDWFHELWLAPYKCGLAGASFSSLVDMVYIMEGP